MTNILDYLKWRGDVTFEASPLNEIDSVIFTQLTYVPFDKIVSSDVDTQGRTIEEIFDAHFADPDKKVNMGAIIPAEKILPLFEMMSHSARFKDVRLRAFINEIDLEEEKQMCAICYDLSNGDSYVAFRGTDDNLISWKEDLNMALFTPIPAQKEAVDYLTSVGQTLNGRLYVGGHSKGGNLAVYSSFMVSKEIQNKIMAVHSFDGPGFRHDFMKIAHSNPVMERKITNFLPDASIIGSIFDTVGRRIYVKSSAKGLYQHDAFSWHLERINFITVPNLAKSSIQFHNSLEQWVAGLSDKEKKEFIDAFYKLCTVNDSGTLTDILSNKFKFVGALFKADEQSKKTIWKTMKDSVKGALGFKKKETKLTSSEEKILKKTHLLEAPRGKD